MICRKQLKRFCGLTFTACVVALGSIYMRKKLEDRILDLDICKSCIKELEQHKRSVEILGLPLVIKRPSLENLFNKLTKTDATIALPVIGEKTSGNLLIVASKKETDTDWIINSLKLEVPKHKVDIKE